MTPAETEHFAALRMHVAHLHAALIIARGYLDGGPADTSAGEAQRRIDAALAESEGDVRELLTDADRDAQLVQCRVDLAAAIDATAVIGRRCSAIEGGARHLVAVYRREDAGCEEWAGELTAAVEDLAKVLQPE